MSNGGGQPIMGTTCKFLMLNEENIRNSVSIISGDYWELCCLTCRVKYHSELICYILSVKQRVHFVYWYFIHHIESISTIFPWLEWLKIRPIRGSYPIKSITSQEYRWPTNKLGYNDSPSRGWRVRGVSLFALPGSPREFYSWLVNPVPVDYGILRGRTLDGCKIGSEKINAVL